MKKKQHDGGILKYLRKTMRIMRLSLFLIVISTAMAFSANSYSQNTKLTLDVNSATVKEVLKAIENQSEFLFFYQEKHLDLNRQVTLHVTNQDVETILNQLFAGTNNIYVINDRQVVIGIAPRKELEKQMQSLRGNIKTVVEQPLQKEITGSVKDSRGIPLPGVTIVVKGTTTGTVSENDGNFSLQVPLDANTLVFSFVGMKSQEIELAGRTNVNVIMEEESLGIEEVVAIGYGTMKRSDLTGSVASVGSETISKREVTSIDQSLQGRVAGVSASQLNHQPGETTTIRIRGGNSLSASNEPLWVVDGYPVDNINMLNPNDVESMEILKDASATAIYGSRGANGVILVTTKRGLTGKPVVEFNSSIGLSNAVNMPKLADADLYLEIYEEVLPNAPQIVDPWRSTNTDWLELIYGKTGIRQNYQLSVRGGTERTQYSVSGSYIDQTGISTNIGFNRGTFNLNLDSEINSNLKFGYSSILSRTFNYGIIPNSSIIHDLPTMLNKDENGNYVPISDYPYQKADEARFNHIQNLEDDTNEETRYRILSNLFVEWKISSGLIFRTSWGVDYYNSGDIIYTPAYLRNNRLSIGHINTLEMIDWLNENTLTFDKNFNENHGFNALIGFTQQTNLSKYRNIYGENFLNDLLGIEGIKEAQTQRITPNKQRWDLLSGIARINYRLMEKYLFTAAVRADGSSKFGINNKWGYFPSGAFAWRASEEDFIKNIGIFDYLKFRASYGLTGNQSISPYQSLARISTAKTFLNDAEVVAAYPSSPPYKDLRWEKTAQTDFGVDMAFFESKLSFTADYYIKKTNDLLIDVPLPLTAGGQAFLTRNLGDIENKGFEFSIDTRGDINQMRWNIGLVFSTNKNTVTNIEGRDDYWVQSVSQMGDFLKIEEGEPVGNIWGYVTDGIYQKNDDFSIEGSEPGNIKFVDQNNDNKITAEDRVIIGNAIPDFIAGLNMDFFYKNFELNILFNSSVGNDLVNVDRAKWEIPNPSANFLAKAGRERWREDYPSTTFPKAAPGFNQGQKITDRIVEDASFLRLQNLRVAYHFHANNISWLQNAMLFVSGQNLFILTKYSGTDPEVSTTGNDVLSLGGDYSAYPATRGYIIGLNVKF